MHKSCVNGCTCLTGHLLAQTFNGVSSTLLHSMMNIIPADLSCAYEGNTIKIKNGGSKRVKMDA
jgi:hypothetical protein